MLLSSAATTSQNLATDCGNSFYKTSILPAGGGGRIEKNENTNTSKNASLSNLSLRTYSSFGYGHRLTDKLFERQQLLKLAGFVPGCCNADGESASR